MIHHWFVVYTEQSQITTTTTNCLKKGQKRRGFILKKNLRLSEILPKGLKHLDLITVLSRHVGNNMVNKPFRVRVEWFSVKIRIFEIWNVQLFYNLTPRYHQLEHTFMSTWTLCWKFRCSVMYVCVPWLSCKIYLNVNWFLLNFPVLFWRWCWSRNMSFSSISLISNERSNYKTWIAVTFVASDKYIFRSVDLTLVI